MMKALIYENELEYIAKCVLDFPDIETGGDLFGFWTHTGCPSIQYVLGPGPDSVRKSTAFYQDREYLIKMGNRLRLKFGLQHIGEWHSHHHLGLKNPSSGDEKTIRKAIKKYELHNFFLTICTIEDRIVNINGFHFSSNESSYQNGAWVVLKGNNPIRNEFDAEHKGLIYLPKNNSVRYFATTTTLDEETESNVINAPLFPEGSWMNEKNGKEKLKKIVDTLKKQFNSEVKIYQTKDKQIILEFNLDNKLFTITFPHDFPEAKPEIRLLNNRNFNNEFLNSLNREIVWREKNWDNYIFNFIKALYSIDEII